MNRSLRGIYAVLFLCFFAGVNDGLAAKGIRVNWSPLPVPRFAPGFKRLKSAATGIDFLNLLGNERSIRNRNLLSGSGVAAGDIDNDGWCDLFLRAG